MHSQKLWPRFYINNQFVTSESGSNKQFQNIPIPTAGVKDLKNAVEFALQASAIWGPFTAHQKINSLYAWAKSVEEQASVISGYLKEVYPKNAHRNFTETLNTHYAFCGWPGKFEAIVSGVNWVGAQHFSYTLPEPIGTTAVLPNPDTSWADCWKAVLALLCTGNTVILLVGLKHAAIAQAYCRALQNAALPPGTLNVLFQDWDALNLAAASHRGIRGLMFPGSASEALYEAMSSHQKIRIPWNLNSDLELLNGTVQFKTLWNPQDTLAVNSSAKY